MKLARAINVSSLFVLVMWFPEVSLAKPVVTVSVEPVAMLAREICADDCEVITLVPKGVSEHSWQPGPKDIVKAKSAQASVGIGLNFDEVWFKKINPAPASMLWLGKSLNPMSWWSDDMLGRNDHDAHGHGHEHDAIDPHVWSDAGRMSTAATLIGQHLAKSLTGVSGSFEKRALDISQRLTQLQLDVDARRKTWRTRPVVMFHDVAGYFARRFNLPVLSVSAGNAGHDLSARMIADVAKRFRGASVAGIMVERDDGAAKSLARELKTKIKVVDFAASRHYAKWDDWYLHVVSSWEDVLR